MARLRRRFLEFHRANPWVYAKVCGFCDQLWDAGWRHYSMRTVIAVVRFDRDLKTEGSTVTVAGGEVISVKLNDQHSAYYARLVAYHNRRLRSFFEYRCVEGEQKEAPILFSDKEGDPDIYLDGSPVPLLKPKPPRRPKPKSSPGQLSLL